VYPGDDHRLGGLQQFQPVVGQDPEPGGAAHRAAGRGAHAHPVLPPPGRVAGGAEHLRRNAEVHADDVFEGEHGDPVTAVTCCRSHGPIIAHIGFPATRRGVLSDPDSTA
jgi:hypothetical protein